MWLNVFNLITFLVVGVILTWFSLSMPKYNDSRATKAEQDNKKLKECMLIVGIFLLCVSFLELLDLTVFKGRINLSKSRRRK